MFLDQIWNLKRKYKYILKESLNIFWTVIPTLENRNTPCKKLDRKDYTFTCNIIWIPFPEMQNLQMTLSFTTFIHT